MSKMTNPNNVNTGARENKLTKYILLLILLSPVVAQSANYNPHSMRDTVVGESDLRRPPGERLAVEFHTAHSAANAAWVFDRDFITCRAVSIDNLESRPLARDARIDQQRFAADTKAQYPLEARPIHPSRRARVPCPSSPPDMRRHRVHVGARDVRLDFVATDPSARVRMIDRVQRSEERRVGKEGRSRWS